MNLAREEQLAALKKKVREMFIIFEHKEGAKMILASDIPNVPRAMGYNLTSVQEQQLQQKLEMAAAIDDANHVALEHYEGVAASWILDNMDALRRDDLHTILRAFRTLDNDDKGYVQTDTLQVRLIDPCSRCDPWNAFIADSCMLEHPGLWRVHPIISVASWTHSSWLALLHNQQLQRNHNNKTACNMPLHCKHIAFYPNMWTHHDSHVT